MVKIPILQHLEYLRDEELEERREKRRRQLAEEEESKQNERRASGAEQSREQNIQVCSDALCCNDYKFMSNVMQGKSRQLVLVLRALEWGQ